MSSLPNMEQNTPNLPRLLMMDDHQVISEAITRAVSADFAVQTASNQKECLDALNTFHPDLVLLDVGMTDNDGFATAEKIKQQQPTLPIAFLSMHVARAYLEKATKLGAKAYISKQIPVQGLISQLKAVLNGEAQPITTCAHDSDTLPLTFRQIEVLKLIAAGASAKDVANALNITVRTAEFHRNDVMHRLNLHSSAQLTRFAMDQGLG